MAEVATKGRARNYRLSSVAHERFIVIITTSASVNRKGGKGEASNFEFVIELALPAASFPPRNITRGSQVNSWMSHS